MRPSVLRSLIAILTLVLGASSAQAQPTLFGKPIEELRVDLVGLSLGGGGTSLNAAVPGGLSLGLYLSEKLAVEPTFRLGFLSPDEGDSQVTLGAGVMVPYYFAGDRGRTGLFVAPTLSLSKVGDADLGIDFGADIGLKRALSEKTAWRLAATLRTGDSSGDEMVLGGVIGISLFLR